MSFYHQYSLKKIAINATDSIAYIDSGLQKDVLLFIHGMGCTSAIWQEIIDQLSPNFRCIAIDLPSYGESTELQGSFSLSKLAEGVFEFIKAMKLEDSNLSICGHSMGAQISIIMAIKYSSVIQKLVLLSPAGIEQFNDRERRYIKAGTSLYPSELLKASTMAMLNEPVHDFLKSIHLPTLIMFGANDPMIPNPISRGKTTKGIAQFGHHSIPQSELHLLPLKGHFLPLDSVNEVSNAIKTFIKK